MRSARPARCTSGTSRSTDGVVFPGGGSGRRKLAEACVAEDAVGVSADRAQPLHGHRWSGYARFGLTRTGSCGTGASPSSPGRRRGSGPTGARRLASRRLDRRSRSLPVLVLVAGPPSRSRHERQLRASAAQFSRRRRSGADDVAPEAGLVAAAGLDGPDVAVGSAVARRFAIPLLHWLGAAGGCLSRRLARVMGPACRLQIHGPEIPFVRWWGGPAPGPPRRWSATGWCGAVG